MRNVDRSKFAREAAVAFVAVAPAFAFGGPSTITPLLPFILVVAAVLAIYIWVALKLRPVRAMIFGVASTAAVYVVVYIVDKIQPGFMNTHARILLAAMVAGVLMGCGLVAFVVGLVRFGLRLWRKS